MEIEPVRRVAFVTRDDAVELVQAQMELGAGKGAGRFDLYIEERHYRRESLTCIKVTK